MVRKFSHLVPWALILAAGVVACSASQREAAPSASRAEPASALGEELAFGRRATGLDKTAGEAEASAQDSLATLAANQPDRYLIKNAWLQLEVDDAPKAIESLSAAARNLGGYLSDMHERKLAVERSEITATLRVPADKFEQAMTDAQALGDVIERRVNSEDVTEKYVDTESSIRNLKRTEERLLAHLERSAKLEDILKVEQELTRVRGLLDHLEGQLRFLSNRVGFSTIQVTLLEKETGGPLTPAGSFSTAGVASRAVRSLVEFLQSLWVVVIWLGVWAPVWLFPLLLVLYAWHRRNRRRVQRTTATPPDR